MSETELETFFNLDASPPSVAEIEKKRATLDAKLDSYRHKYSQAYNRFRVWFMLDAALICVFCVIVCFYWSRHSIFTVLASIVCLILFRFCQYRRLKHHDRHQFFARNIADLKTMQAKLDFVDSDGLAQFERLHMDNVELVGTYVLGIVGQRRLPCEAELNLLRRRVSCSDYQRGKIYQRIEKRRKNAL